MPNTVHQIPGNLKLMFCKSQFHFMSPAVLLHGNFGTGGADVDAIIDRTCVRNLYTDVVPE